MIAIINTYTARISIRKIMIQTRYEQSNNLTYQKTSYLLKLRTRKEKTVNNTNSRSSRRQFNIISTEIHRAYYNMNIKTCLQLAKALYQLSKFDRWNSNTKYMVERISVLHSCIRTDHQCLIFSTQSVPDEYSNQLIWSYIIQHKQVEGEHNISLKDSSKKFTRNLFTPLPLRKSTQLSLQKQDNRENFFEVPAIPGIGFCQNIEQAYNQISNQEQKSEIKIVDR